MPAVGRLWPSDDDDGGDDDDLHFGLAAPEGPRGSLLLRMIHVLLDLSSQTLTINILTIQLVNVKPKLHNSFFCFFYHTSYFINHSSYVHVSIEQWANIIQHYKTSQQNKKE